MPVDLWTMGSEGQKDRREPFVVESRLAHDETIVDTVTDAYNTTTQVAGLARTTKRKGKKKQDSNKSKAKAKATS